MPPRSPVDVVELTNTRFKLYVLAVEKLQAFKDEAGAAAIESGLIAAGIAVAIIVAVGLLGDRVDEAAELEARAKAIRAKNAEENPAI